MDGQTSRSRVPSNARRLGLKVNCSVGDWVHYCNDERQMSAGSSTRESVHFLPPDLIKRRFTGLSREDHCWERNRGERDGTLQCMCVCTRTLNQHMRARFFAHVLCFSPHACLFFCVQAVIMLRPLASLTLLARDERHLFF